MLIHRSTPIFSKQEYKHAVQPNHLFIFLKASQNRKRVVRKEAFGLDKSSGP